MRDSLADGKTRVGPTARDEGSDFNLGRAGE